MISSTLCGVYLNSVGYSSKFKLKMGFSKLLCLEHISLIQAMGEAGGGPP